MRLSSDSFFDRVWFFPHARSFAKDSREAGGNGSTLKR
jgi:hypothetical protein